MLDQLEAGSVVVRAVGETPVTGSVAAAENETKVDASIRDYSDKRRH